MNKENCALKLVDEIIPTEYLLIFSTKHTSIEISVSRVTVTMVRIE